MADALSLNFILLLWLSKLIIEDIGVFMMQQIVPFLYLAAGIWIAAFLGETFYTLNWLTVYSLF